MDPLRPVRWIHFAVCFNRIMWIALYFSFILALSLFGSFVYFYMINEIKLAVKPVQLNLTNEDTLGMFTYKKKGLHIHRRHSVSEEKQRPKTSLLCYKLSNLINFICNIQ